MIRIRAGAGPPRHCDVEVQDIWCQEQHRHEGASMGIIDEDNESTEPCRKEGWLLIVGQTSAKACYSKPHRAVVSISSIVPHHR